jgi:hypothetical protein
MNRVRTVLARAPRPRGPSSWLALIGLSLSFVRFTVLFIESYAVVAAERTADQDLLKLCSSGAAADSTKFRSLCLSARAESSAPLLFKALLKSLKTGVHDFFEAFNSPTKIALLVLFCLSGLALPIVKAVSMLATQHLGPDKLARLQGLHLSDDEESPDCQVVVLNGGASDRSAWARINSRLRRVPGRRRDKLLTIADEDEFPIFDANDDVYASIGT